MFMFVFLWRAAAHRIEVNDVFAWGDLKLLSMILLKAELFLPILFQIQCFKIGAKMFGLEINSQQEARGGGILYIVLLKHFL